MSDALTRIQAIRADAEAAVDAAGSSDELEDVRIRYLGRKAELPQLLRGVRDLPPDERGAVGKAGNQARQAIEAAIEERTAALEAGELDARLTADAIDVTLPGAPPLAPGRLNLITATRREIEDIFLGLGFTAGEGPEVDLVY